jgi:hypothetical protein
VEDQRLVVSLVGQLEEGSVGVDGISEVRPQRHRLRVENEVSLKGGESARAEKGEKVPSDDSAYKPGEESSDRDCVSADAEDGKRESAGGLSAERGTK